MHIPDGFVNQPLCAAAFAVSGVVCAGALRKTNQSLAERQAPVLGMTGAFIFAAQMLNFPIGPGSGHFMGGALAVVLLGPANAILVMALVLAVQCFLLADGGYYALGMNILTISITSCLSAAVVLRVARHFCTGNRAIYLLWTAVAAFISVVASAVVCGAALYFSGVWPVVGWVAIVSIHVPIGIGEALITYGALSVIFSARPDIVTLSHNPRVCEVTS